jgi:hypothetical protein
MTIETLRYFGFILLFTLFLVGAVQNWAIFWSVVVKHRPNASGVPFVFGLLGCVGLVLLPIEGSWKLAWLPLLLDWGSVPTHAAELYLIIRSKKRDQ